MIREVLLRSSDVRLVMEARAEMSATEQKATRRVLSWDHAVMGWMSSTLLQARRLRLRTRGHLATRARSWAEATPGPDRLVDEMFFNHRSTTSHQLGETEGRKAEATMSQRQMP